MMINFIDGVYLGNMFGRGDLRPIREDIPGTDIEYIYRPIAHFMLQLYKIDFGQISSLPTLKPDSLHQPSPHIEDT